MVIDKINIINRHPTFVAVALFLNFVVLIGTAGYLLIDNFKQLEKEHTFENLHSIGILKVGQIQEYFKERKGDALIASNFLSNTTAGHWLANPSGNLPAAVRRSLENSVTDHLEGGVLLLDSKGNVRFGSGQYVGLSETAKSFALQAIQKNLPSTSPIYFGDPSAPGKPLLDTFVPIKKPDSSAVIGVLVLRDDLHFLFSLVQSWPVESKSGETLLVTRDGDDVLFLNELRYKSNTALKFRVPITGDANANIIPTVEMMKGRFGAMEGHDYRGKPTLAYNIAVPDTPWGMVVKIDMDEALGHIARLQLVVWIITAFFIAGAGIILLMWRKKQKSESVAHEQLARVAADLRISAIAFETQEAIMITDCEPKILRVNQAFQDVTGYAANEVIGQNPSMLSAEIKPKAFYEEMWAAISRDGKWSGEMLDRRKNGEAYAKWLTITAVKAPDGTLTHYVGSFFDVSERKKAEEEIYRLAFFDSLTALPNRRLLLDRLEHALAASARSGRQGAIMFIDLDNFKAINDTKGHNFGDLILIETGRRLQSCMREGDTVARLGGDEFVVMLEDLGIEAKQAAAQADEVGEKIRGILNQPYMLECIEYYSTASIGICLFMDKTTSADTLLKNADIAMYQAKDAGRNTVRFFNPDMQSVLEARTAIETDLHSALTGRQFVLYYQAQVDVAGRILGAEALLRWIHPLRGMIPPAFFIPIAEESSLILDIGHWVLDTACRQIALWCHDDPNCELVLAVNVSARQFKSSGFVDSVAEVISKHRISPARLKVELTESLVLEDLAAIVEKMYKLKELGVGLSMDDFGTGYSSLSYLRRLPLNQLKIDKSFVNDIVTNQDDATMVKTIINLAHNFRMSVIAEGVETKEQLVFLKQHGCMVYQGYLFSKPVPIEEFEMLLGSPSQLVEKHSSNVAMTPEFLRDGMMELAWTEQLSVGNEKIDAQHKKLITMVNGLQHMIKARAISALPEAFEQLECWLRVHISDEENIAKAVNHCFTQNKLEHEHLLEEFQRMKEVFVAKNGMWSDDEAEYYSVFLSNWITNHVLSEDMLMKPVLLTYPYEFMSD